MRILAITAVLFVASFTDGQRFFFGANEMTYTRTH